MRYFVAISIFLSFSVAPRIEAPTPPESYALKELKPGEALVDPAFAAWEESVNAVVEPTDMSTKQFEEFVQGLSLTERLFVDLKRIRQLSRKKRRQFIADFERNFANETYRNKLKEHILYPDVLNEVIESNLASKSLIARLDQDIAAWPGHICPQKEMILRQLDRGDRELLSAVEVRGFLTKISGFNSQRFQRMALEDLLEMTDEEKHHEIREELAEAIRPHSKLVSDHKWVLDEKTKAEDETLQEPHLSLSKVTENTQRRRCNTAKKHLISGIRKDTDKSQLMKVATMTNKVESCFRRQGRRARLRFLSRMKKHLEAQYGFQGEEIVLRRKALIYWSRDKFEQTREILSYLVENAKKGNHKEILARTLYTTARVDENEGKLEKAVASYESYVNQFPKDEKVNEAKTSLVMLHTITGKPQTALRYAEELITSETLKAMDDRDASTLSLALFWAGKLSLSMGDRIKTMEYWRRLASEFYSTFYGAVGHYMLETLMGKRLVLQPVRVPKFDKDHLLKVYTKDEQVTVDRIEALLKLGLKGEASCETKELGGEPDDHRKNLVKAMYLHASGDWLASIKKFVNLPRAFRHSLPRGMERLLFPKAYADTVQSYARRLDVDPDYVFAIIRQESVFNPQARSPVGAAGLMQLMPATARLEARSLQRGYVPNKHRKALINKARKKRIYEAEANLALGIHHVYRLFKKYKNPIHVLTSYNANPTATEKWMANIDASDTLAYIERIPYRETRAYVKLVMRNYFYYKRWYRDANEPSPFMDFLAPKSIELAKAGERPQELTR
ncbi:lytic transglycosylase domain-containing protein [Pseudobacteriovorax antillogorgiicola]|uniref:Soluble lytic murein transglycosylase n=1 Tax=Pseudobacteriovorax antillogorgiicola TaxID=1513793 RepID=A0A1Y6BTM9_9BACT|nr:lytic transglycosylase domain-containing protein [Pseudobacteriovorax antillogorgiicola]TCS53904.1 soluble lytic murein transglycosylase-like protein [Pseudobacteriovorax antillogorgiicola]SMF20728.1 Soluble lytic murein transglycosylase [Pseudobacteriovorax antillogorgiicola]